MLTIPGPRSRFCDGMSRRSWLRIGGLGLGGLALPEILRGEARSGVRNPAKGIIMVLLPGGPSHLDMYDLKPTAPAEIRGEFLPISTNVPGLDICELLPKLGRDVGQADADPLAIRISERSQYPLVFDWMGVPSADGFLADRGPVIRRGTGRRWDQCCRDNWGRGNRASRRRLI